MKIPIVIIAYNRHNSLTRLLNSLKIAHYDNQDVDLIISIDKNDNNKVYEVAEEFNWPYGSKIVIKKNEKLGLRKHVLACGDLVFDYDAIIMLEDDLIVSETFYRFATQSVDFYKKDKKIGGISLYSYPISEFANLRTFTPLQDDSDIYFMNVPSSWGQIWTKNQWSYFREWYNNSEYQGRDFEGIIPAKALGWRESSWKKYFYMYIGLKKKYIVYPRIGLSTNMGDVGTHHKIVSNEHQTILMRHFNRKYIFKELNDSESVYDAFFENEKLSIYFELNDKVVIDYYGIKTNLNNIRYLLSTRRLNHKVIKQWGLALKPYEMNILFDIKGSELFLYDMEMTGHFLKEVNTNNESNLIKYELPGITKEKALKIVFTEYLEAIRRKFKAL